MFRVATFNIRHGAPAGGRADLDATAEACRGLGAQLLALQEVDRRRRRSGGRDQAAVIARRCGLHHWFVPTLPSPLGGYGLALLSAAPLRARQVVVLPEVGAERRLALLAAADLAGTAVSVAATHLAPDPRTLDLQLPAVLGALLARPGPHLLLGDLNAGPPEVVDVLEKAGFAVAPSGPTFPATAPRRRIDWVAVRGLTPARSRVPELTVSDHRPVVVDLAPEAAHATG